MESFIVFVFEQLAMDGILHCFLLWAACYGLNPSLFLLWAACYGWNPSLFSSLGSLLWMESFIVFFFRQPAMDGILHYFLLWAACYGWNPSLFSSLGSLLWMESFIIFFFGKPAMEWVPSLPSLNELTPFWLTSSDGKFEQTRQWLLQVLIVSTGNEIQAPASGQ
ncbi:unnamed protein product [Cuscuta epithymum]|uniref:Uncharacterized protein n=1 Tax=Cuscuta epithymum TaxID=186058 RepID=A0AAV0EK46_9ASTE|nr:unnamed protein product [Cuscuta epithymum]